VPRARSSTKAPQIAPIRLGRLTDGDIDALTRDADLESLHYTDLSVPHLDLDGAVVSGVRFDGLVAGEAGLKGARLSDVELVRVDLPVVRAARSQWRDVSVSGRLGSVEAYESVWRSVHFIGCKLSFANFRSAELLDVAFTDCIIEELDLVSALLRRVRLRNTSVEHLNVQHSELHDFDLRGARLSSINGLLHLHGTTINSDQLTSLAPLMAEGLGLKVAD